MGLDLIANFSVVQKVDVNEEKGLFDMFMSTDEQVLLSYKHTRDRVIFTSKKIIAYDVKGFSGTKKEFKFFPYNKISSFSVETAGSFDMDSDMKIWVSGVGVFAIKFGLKIDIKEIGVLLASKI